MLGSGLLYTTSQDLGQEAKEKVPVLLHIVCKKNIYEGLWLRYNRLTVGDNSLYNSLSGFQCESMLVRFEESH